MHALPWLAVAVLAFLATGSALGSSTARADDDALSIVSVAHDGSTGQITASIVTTDSAAVPDDLTVLVDGVPFEAQSVSISPSPPGLLVVAIEASSSMADGQLWSAKAIALDVIDRIPPDTRVSVVTFADDVTLLLAPTSDHAAARTAVGTIVPGGASELYGAVDLTAELLADAPASGSLLLLTYGWSFGNAVEASREGSTQAISDAGAPAHVVALGADFDGPYLNMLADRSGGSFQTQWSESALELALSDLGTGLSRFSVVLDAADLSPGEHTLTVKLGGDQRSATFTAVSGPSMIAAAPSQPVVRAIADPPAETTAAPPDSEGGDTLVSGETGGGADAGRSSLSQSPATLASLAGLSIALMVGLAVLRRRRHRARRRTPASGPIDPIAVSDLTGALIDGEFTAYYQPVFNPETERLVGIEAFLRWESPRFGLVSARRFLARAEAGGLLAQLDALVFTSACRFAAELRSPGIADLVVTLNASQSTVFAPDFCAELADLLEEVGLPPEHVLIALSERTVAVDLSRGAGVVRQLRGLGVHVSVDGFWSTGLAVEEIVEIGIESVTVDLSSNAGNAATRRQISDAVAEAHALGLSVTAKRVASDVELAFSRELRCEYVQGYAFCEPLPAEAFLGRLSDFTSPDALTPARSA